MEQDRNLLFGVLAVQLGKVTSSRLMQAAAAWAIDPATPLDARLVEQGALTQQDHDLIDRLVGEAIRAHSGDAKATLNTFGGAEQVVKTFGGAVAITDEGVRPVAPSPDATVAIAPPPETGVLETPNRYKAISEQGRGGYGRVLLVHDQFMARDVALKELIPPSNEPIGSNVPTPSRESIEAVSRFLQEARITGQLEHPSIVPVYELGHREDGALYYTMKLVRGQTLSKELSNRKTLRERLELLPRYLDLCHAIAYAHDRGVIHRDIKPDNVMIGSFGETVVIDWGLAKLKGRADVYAAELKATAQALKEGPAGPGAQTLYGTILGTPHYMAPEQARGDIDSVDERSDVYALGAVLYMLLTGTRPYDKAPLQNVILHINLPPLASAAELAPGAPPELVTICNKALETKQADRYQNAAEIAGEIQRFMSGALVESHEYTVRDQVRRFVRKYKAQVVTASVALAALLTVAIVSYVQILQANANERNQRLAAEEAKQLAVEKGEQEAEARGLAERELYVSNVRLAYQSVQDNQFDAARALLAACPPTHRNWEWGYLAQACNQDLATLQGHAAPVLDVAVSRDGAIAASGDSTGTVIVWDVVSGNERRRAKAMDGPVISLSFSPDGQSLAVAGKAKEVSICSVETLEQRFSLAGHGAAVNAVAYSADGRALATASSDDTVRIWNLDTHESTAVLSEHLNDVVAVAWAPGKPYLVSGSLDNSLAVWDTAAWSVVRRMDGHTNDVNCLAISPDGERVASGGADGNVIVWSIADGTRIQTRQFGADIRDLSFAPDGKRIAVAPDGAVAQMVPAAGDAGVSYSLCGHSATVTGVAFLPSGDQVLTASEDSTAKLWHAPTELAGPARLPAGATTQELFLADRDSRRYVIASTLGKCGVYDSQKGEVTAVIEDLGTTGLGGRLWGFSPLGRYLLYTGEDNRPKVCNLVDGSTVELKLKGAPFNPGFAQKSDRVAIASTSGEIETYDANTGDMVSAFSAGQPSTHNLPFFSADDSKVFTIAMDKTESEIAMFDASTGQPLWKAMYPGGSTDAAFAPHVERIFVSGSAGLRVYDIPNGEELTAQYEFPRLALGAIAFSSAGERIVAELDDLRLIVLDGVTGREILRLDRDTPNAPAQRLSHAGLSFSSDGRQLHIVSTDRQGLATWTEFSAFEWSDSRLSGDAAKPIVERIEQYKRLNRADRLSAAVRRDNALKWVSAEAAEIAAHAASVSVKGEADPFANATVKEWDISPGQWTMLLQMGRNRLKQLRDVHGYRGMKAASDLVLDKTLADFLSVLGFENNDIIVRINGSSTPGYDMFIEALETAQRENLDKITCHFYRSGQPMIHVYYRTEPAAKAPSVP
ncbi:MAG: protein kinase [Candidatus Hydrogenedentes bacterium]|nr:protein kinase [Candidatus Hydrogenedentota bacterium]